MTATPVSRVDFSTLTSELRILPIAPSWAEVERAMTRLDRLTPESCSEAQKDEQVQRDIQTVQDFSQNLEENRESLALALYCAAILGTAGSGTQGERVAAGLRAISRCYRFHRLSREERLQELQILAKEIQRRLEVPALESPPELTADQWKSWWEEIRTESKRLGEKELWAEATDRAWELWATRLLEDFTQKNISVFRPRLEDLAGAVGEQGPDRLFRFDLTEMSLADWSSAFCEVSSLDANHSKLVAPTLVPLMGPRPGILLVNIAFSGSAIRATRSRAKASLSLLVRHPASILAEKLYPATIAGLVALDPGQLKRFGFLGVLRPDLLLIELPVEEHGAAEWGVTAKRPVEAAARFAEVIKGSQKSLNQLEHVYVAPHDAKVEAPKDAPIIYGPKDADDLLLQAQFFTGIDLAKKTDSEPVKSSKLRKKKTDEDG